jgi:hypothetical protein
MSESIESYASSGGIPMKSRHLQLLSDDDADKYVVVLTWKLYYNMHIIPINYQRGAAVLISSSLKQQEI